MCKWLNILHVQAFWNTEMSDRHYDWHIWQSVRPKQFLDNRCLISSSDTILNFIAWPQVSTSLLDLIKNLTSSRPWPHHDLNLITTLTQRLTLLLHIIAWVYRCNSPFEFTWPHCLTPSLGLELRQYDLRQYDLWQYDLNMTSLWPQYDLNMTSVWPYWYTSSVDLIARIHCLT